MAALAAGVALIIAGIAMDGAKGWLIAHLTSRPLGSLAPGFAATDRGFRAYSALVRAIGVIFVAVWALTLSVVLGGVLLLAGVGGFLYLTVVAIDGEVRTYRSSRP